MVRASLRAFHAIGMTRRDRPGHTVDRQPSYQRGSIMAAPTNDTPVLDLLGSMTADSLAASSLDNQTLMLVRIAALAAVDAPPVSYLMNLGAAADAGVDAEQIRGVLTAIAPIVGTARVASATISIVDALDVAIEVAELDQQSES
jgi:alkylhydroperoxidase/carboxymuconolactone decarboxylase family protein YurZ